MNLFYLAKPIYGGWVTFTSHLSLQKDLNIYKITKRTEKKERNFGYNCRYKNISQEDICKYDNIIITAIDKHYYKYLSYFPENTILVIHDPTELKNKDNPLIKDKLIEKFKIVTIRNTVYNYLKDKFNLNSNFIYHPFYKYPINNNLKCINNYAISISRIDFDKNIDIILKANYILPEEKKIQIYGAENRLYVHHKLKTLDFDKYWKGKYDKNLQITYNGDNLLKNTKYLVDLSTIKNDGGGTQYTFLDGIYNNCVLILNKQWINKGNLFIHKYNCICVEDEKQLADFLKNDITNSEYNIILNNSKKILELCDFNLNI